MPDTAQLRAYHAELSRVRTDVGVYRTTRGFSGANTPTMKIIRVAHLARVHGVGSPAECDEALQRALREIGQ